MAGEGESEGTESPARFRDTVRSYLNATSFGRQTEKDRLGGKETTNDVVPLNAVMKSDKEGGGNKSRIVKDGRSRNAGNKTGRAGLPGILKSAPAQRTVRKNRNLGNYDLKGTMGLGGENQTTSYRRHVKW